MGRYEVPWEVSLPDFSIGMIDDYIHIAGVLHVVTDRLKSAMMYLIPIISKLFKCKILSLLEPKALLYIHGECLLHHSFPPGLLCYSSFFA